MTFRRSPKYPDKELLDFLQKCKLIGIHGATSSGKSQLARDLAALIGGTHIEVDKIPSEPKGGKTYLDQINFSILKSKIQSSIHPIIVDCFILLDILEKINIQVDTTLFCERSNDANCDFDRDLELTFATYSMRHHPRASAKMIFTLVYSN